ncbi:MAG: ATP-binding cassette domain-containing protein [Candidatus Nanohaloarchaea archaeon]
MPVVEVKNLEKTYEKSSWKLWKDGRKTEALRGIDFKVKKGEIFGIVGPNGAGKTTLVNILSGLLYKDTGSVKIFDKETKQNRKELADRMNVATAYSKLSGNLTVEENLRVFAKIYDVEKRKEKINHVLELFEISDLRGKKIYHLSAGQKTRANLAKSFINQPEILLLDEATAGLDPHIADVTRKAIRQINEKHDTTIIITSHDMEDIDSLSDRMMFLHQGKILRTGTPRELKKDIHIKVLEVTVDEVNDDFRGLIEHLDGELDGNTARVKIEQEEHVIEILDSISEIDVTVIDIEAKNPDLNEVFKKVARNEV